jgi:spore maturation protein CgeB
MTAPRLRIVILGLSITSSWGNGHATTYRGLVRELAARGHDVLFLERDVEWYAANRDLPRSLQPRTRLYRSLGELRRRFATRILDADLVIVGSYVPEGALIGQWITRIARGITAFYDIDTPVTLARLERGETDYLTRALIPRFNLYLSFTGGPTLERLERVYHASAARVLYCSVDPAMYRPQPADTRWDLGYMGTYSADRQRALNRLLITTARTWWEGRFIVAGAQFPPTIRWPANVKRWEHLPPGEHPTFYSAQRYTLNLTRSRMIAAGFSPSVRLFEAAACATPIITDEWEGLDTILTPGREILVARSSGDVLAYLRDFPEEERTALAARARERILKQHTAGHRAAELEGYALQVGAPRTQAHAVPS